MTAPIPTTRARRTVVPWREQVARLVDTLQRWPYLDTVVTLRQRFREDRLGLTAGSLTFTTLISLVPLVTVMLAAFAAFPMFSSLQEALQNYFLKSLVPDVIARPVLGALTQFSSEASRLGTLGLVALLVSALALMFTIDRTLNAIWRVRTPRPVTKRVLVYWAALTLGPLLLGSSLSLTSYAISASRGLVAGLPGGIELVLGGVEFALTVLGVAALFHSVPNTHVRWQHSVAGALFVAAGLALARKILTWYLVQVPEYAMVYGAFATLPIFLIWIYLSWVIVLLGAVVAAYAPSLQMRVVRWPDAPGWRFHLAIAMLRELADSRDGVRRGISHTALAEALRIDPLQTEPILDALLSLDWIGRLEEAGDARYVLLCNPAETPAEPLVSRLLLQPMPTLRALWQRTGFADMTLQELIAR